MMAFRIPGGHACRARTALRRPRTASKNERERESNFLTIIRFPVAPNFLRRDFREFF